jgi:beta-1,2-mannosidase
MWMPRQAKLMSMAGPRRVAPFSVLVILCVIACAAQRSPADSLSASAWMLQPFQRPPGSGPVITPQRQAVFLDPIRGQNVHWEALHTFNPAAVVRDGQVFLLYRAEDDTGSMGIGEHTSRLGLAVSHDGIHFRQMPEPVFYPDRDGQYEREWPGGVEDPRIVQTTDGLCVLTYTQWNRVTYTVGIAASRDLTHWTKYGPAFGTKGKYANLKYKSAGIVTRLEGDRLVAARIRGRYWMYWGEGKVSLATSADLIHWTPVEDASGAPVTLLAPRPGLFDSALPEVGAPPLLTRRGILLLYNGKNATADGDPQIGPAAYSSGQALFARGNPAELLDRSTHPYFRPEESWERSGQYAAGTTFVEGLVYFHHDWFLYYGCADSYVGVAVHREAQPPGAEAPLGTRN